jgi:Flp pilus assembly protein TadG
VALLAPLLILLIFSVIQVGITFGDWMAVNNAARAGARQAAVFGEGSPTNWSSSCRGVVETARLAAAGVSIAPSVSNGVAVTVRDGGVNAQTLGCAVGMGAASTTVSASEASRPCLGSGEGSRSQDIRVDVEVNPYRIQIPFGINIDTRIAATGVFRCEFK